MSIIKNLYFGSDREQSFSTVLATLLNYDKKRLLLKNILLKINEKEINDDNKNWRSKLAANIDNYEIDVHVEVPTSGSSQPGTDLDKGHIDIQIKLTSQNDEKDTETPQKYYLLIENKVKATKFHDNQRGNQLSNYEEYVKRLKKNKGLDENITVDFIVISVVAFDKLKESIPNYKDNLLSKEKHFLWRDILDILKETYPDEKAEPNDNSLKRMVDDFILDIRRYCMGFKGFNKSIENEKSPLFFPTFIEEFYSFCEYLKSLTALKGKIMNSWNDEMIKGYSVPYKNNKIEEEYGKGYLSAWEYGFWWFVKYLQKEKIYLSIGSAWLEKEDGSYDFKIYLYLTKKINNNNEYIDLLCSGSDDYSVSWDTFKEKFSKEKYEGNVEIIKSKLLQK